MSHVYVIDKHSLRPGCALIQAAMGGDRNVHRYFQTKLWLLAPTPHMVRVRGTAAEWRRIAEVASQRMQETTA